jgi:hypothetical protein
MGAVTSPCDFSSAQRTLAVDTLQTVMARKRYLSAINESLLKSQYLSETVPKLRLGNPPLGSSGFPFSSR